MGTLGGGISSVRGAAGGARHVSIIASIVSLVSAELGEVLHVREPCVCDRTPRARCVLYGVVGSVGGPSLRRWRVVRSLTTTLASSPELSWYFEFRAVLGVCWG